MGWRRRGRRAHAHRWGTLREAILPELLALVEAAAGTGEPILRPMAYHAPLLEEVTDQFFFGPDLIVAPVLEQGAERRLVALPTGTWASPEGALHAGPGTVEVPCSLGTVPRFRRVSQRTMS